MGQNFIRPALASVQGAAVTSPYGGRVRQIQIDLDPQKLQANNLSAQDVGNALAAQNQIIPAGTIKVGQFEYNVKLNNSPSVINELNDLPIKQVNGATIYMRDVAHVRDGSPPQTQYRAHERPPRRADDHPQERRDLDPRHRGWRQGASAAPEADPAAGAQDHAAGRPVDVRARRRLWRGPRRRNCRRC